MHRLWSWFKDRDILRDEADGNILRCGQCGFRSMGFVNFMPNLPPLDKYAAEGKGKDPRHVPGRIKLLSLFVSAMTYR